MVQATKLPVNTDVTASQLAGNIFGNGVSVVSASYSGDALSKGIYSNGNAISPGVVPADSGVILSTGYANSFTNATGNANQSNRRGIDVMEGVDDNVRLNALAGMETYDGAILEAEFIPQGSVLSMQIVFSSEEYNEFVNQNFNDVVGIFVNNQQATLTVGTGDISINNINNGYNNNGQNASNENLFINNRGNDYNTEMDGFTVTLTLKAPVFPGQVNSIWIGIADAGDATFDSNLLIAANSVQTVVIAADDAAETGRGSTTMLDVLGNDSAAGGVTLTITQINGQNVSAGDSVTLLSGTVVTLNEDGTLTFETADQLGEETLSYTISDSSDNTDVGFIAINVTCFASGTGIMTPRGEVPINHLSVDDLVTTRDHGAQPLRWIGSTQLGADKLDAFPHLRPIRVTAGALGRDLPVRDLVVSPQHRILVRSRIAQKMFGTNEVLVAAIQLLQLDGVEIAADLQIVEYFHMLFDRHEVVISDGAESESLYTGPEALKALPAAVADEVFTLFPELRDAGHIPVPARPLASGRMARRLTVRHVQNNRPLISAI